MASVKAIFNAMFDSILKLTLEEIIDFCRYPLHTSSTQAGHTLIKYCQTELASRGYIILKRFIASDALRLAQIECQRLLPLAKHSVRYTNPYKTEDDPTLPLEHPIRHFALRTNAFIAKSKFSENSIFQTLYHSQLLKIFLASCVGLNRVYEYADPLGALVLNVLSPRGQHPWHFDENDFSAVLMIQTPKQGGVFQIAPNIRTFAAENFEQVSQVLQGKSKQDQSVNLDQGDLIIFNGKLSLHRVTEVLGKKERYTIVFSYAQQPGRVGRLENNSKVFG
ncbi:MAG: putative 2OG-Fe(II) oxygenase [Cyanobacteria bacterium J06635_15]